MFKITGFMQLDNGFYGYINNIATVGNAQDGTEFRRVRLAVPGKVAEFTSYQVEMEFVGLAGRPSFFDNYVEQGNLPILAAVRMAVPATLQRRCHERVSPLAFPGTVVALPHLCALSTHRCHGLELVGEPEHQLGL